VLDEFDLKILTVLQNNADLSLAEICKAVGIGSASAASKRIKELRKQGYIHKTVAIVNHDLLGYNFRTVTSVVTSKPYRDADELKARLAKIKGVVSAYETLGAGEILLLTVSRNLEEYREMIREISGISGVESIRTTVLSKVLFDRELATMTLD